ncbi:hypothetical protein LX87_03982 [Larkinella arboricola]|uniref:Uncharacterized protein n=1 Tax=Larkinella arboricola TaxID=643671 RepID=A0A327WP12_LARAB|nr:hypothetical protein [Larkinella arboricola]RAJ94098.1 hypothetical protein LX87_03982 [Larkinella arboricola]
MEKDKEINEKDIAAIDNRHRADQEDSANAIDSREITGGEDGRNDRFMGGMDMDSRNGLLRFNDSDDNNNSPAEDITEEGQKSVVSSGPRTNTSMVDVTTHGPDDYPSAEDVPVPNAQKEAKEQAQDEPGAEVDQSGGNNEDEMSQSGTSTDHKPVY